MSHVSSHLRLCVQHFNHACSERLRCYISILVSARTGLSLLWRLTTQGCLVYHQLLFPRHLPFALRTSRGTPPTIYPVNTQPLAFRLFAQGKPLQVSHYARHPTSRTSPFTGNISAAMFSSKWLLFVGVSCLCLFLPHFPCLSFCSSPVSALKRFRGTLL